MSEMLLLYLVTQNKNKIAEIAPLLEGIADLKDLTDFNIAIEIPETGNTLEENAFQKADYVFKRHSVNCFADDSGLEVEFLKGAPGVFSARYAGEPKNNEKNIDKLLGELAETKNRKARFRTVISLLLNGEKHFFEGIIEGKITEEKRGASGFGYDPVFIPDGYEKTFAEMSAKEKNKISHRAIAIAKMIDFLKNYQLNSN